MRLIAAISGATIFFGYNTSVHGAPKFPKERKKSNSGNHAHHPAIISSTTPEETNGEESFSVFTQNLFALPYWIARNQQRERLEASARAICTMDPKPDVLVFQEMNATSDDVELKAQEKDNTMFREILKKCEYEHQFYEVNMDGEVAPEAQQCCAERPFPLKAGGIFRTMVPQLLRFNKCGKGGRSGIMIASRYPFEKRPSSQGHGVQHDGVIQPFMNMLQTWGSVKARWAQTFWKGFKYVEVKKGGQIWGVVGTHLDPFDTEAVREQRRQQVAQMQAFLNAEQRDRPGAAKNVVIAADFNADMHYKNFDVSDSAKRQETLDNNGDRRTLEMLNKDFVGKVAERTNPDNKSAFYTINGHRDGAKLQFGDEGSKTDNKLDVLNELAVYETPISSDPKDTKQRFFDFVLPYQNTETGKARGSGESSTAWWKSYAWDFRRVRLLHEDKNVHLTDQRSRGFFWEYEGKKPDEFPEQFKTGIPTRALSDHDGVLAVAKKRSSPESSHLQDPKITLHGEFLVKTGGFTKKPPHPQQAKLQRPQQASGRLSSFLRGGLGRVRQLLGITRHPLHREPELLSQV